MCTEINSLYPVRPSPLFISQSLIKMMIKNPEWYTDDNNYTKTFCPKQLYHLFFIKDYNLRFFNEMSQKWEKDVLIKGQFGESRLLGLTASNETIDSLEKNKRTGADRKDETRIKRMSQLAKVKFMYHQIMVHEAINTQVPIAAHIERDVWIRTKLDLFPTQIILNPQDKDDKPILACIDVKFPKSLSGFGNFDWSNFEHMNHTQPNSIFWQFDRLDVPTLKTMFPEFESTVGYDNVLSGHVLNLLPSCRFFYFIVAYDAITEENIIIKEWTRDRENEQGTGYRQKEYEEQQRRCIEMLEMFFDTGFSSLPFINVREGMGCHKCPLNRKLNSKGCCDEFIELPKD